ncbi:MAG TPA: dihydrolipoamide acetyltransferase family protein [Ktedonobacteraceae bacterium]|nr:dihydrolipoamide acetyltransferase family protein [Ktedonobacteraceae bacterium]
MATEIVLPQWSMGMADGTIVRWLKQEGDEVRQGEPLVEVEAAKVTSEVEAEVSGVLARILVAEGETVPVRTPLCVIGAADEVVAGTATPTRAAASAAETAASLPPAAVSQPSGQVTPVARKMAKEYGIDLSRVRGSGPGGRIVAEDVQRAIEEVAHPVPPPAPQVSATVQIIPAARKLAKEHGIGLEQIRGSGPGGRITVEDVQQVITAAARSVPSPSPLPETSSSTGQVIPLTGMRGTIARRMQQSVQTSAQVTLISEVDVSALVRLREMLKEQFALTYTDLIVKAVALALKEHPRLNARVEGEHIWLEQAIDIGVAVALDEGLIVPVVRNADRKALQEIAQETRQLARRAREGTLSREEITGSTFSVTNLGVYGIDAFTPIINPPEVAILGIGRLNEKFMRVSQEGEWRQVMTLSLTFDHRAVDGAPAAAFLQTLARYLENAAELTG